MCICLKGISVTGVGLPDICCCRKSSFGWAEFCYSKIESKFRLYIKDIPEPVYPVHHIRINLITSYVFLNEISLAKPVLWTSGTAQIGEGLENSWGDFEGSEREEEEEEEEVAPVEPIPVEDQHMETGGAVAGTRNQKGQYPPPFCCSCC